MPEIFALVAVIGNPSDRASSSANDSPGILTAIFPVFAVSRSEIFAFAGSNSVSGPGQNFSISFSADSVTDEAMSSSMRFSPIMSGRALFGERHFEPVEVLKRCAAVEFDPKAVKGLCRVGYDPSPLY